MIITVQIKSDGVNNLTYPVCEKAQLFAKIAGTATLADSAIRHIHSLGYTVRQISGVSDNLVNHPALKDILAGD